VYLGSGLMLCEAQLDPLGGKCSVIIARLWDYLGSHEILVRRSKRASKISDGWALATAVATKIGDAYDWRFILKFLAKRVAQGDQVWLSFNAHLETKSSFVCSSLYSTAHAYVTDVSITDKTNGLCVPAFLAAEGKHLVNVDYEWLKIAGSHALVS
jgi:hypothetical protein